MSTARHSRPLVLHALLLLAAASVAWADDEGIVTDRPDFVESSATVGAGRFQLETSVAFERDRSDGIRTRTRSTPTLLRYGIAEDWELRLETDGALRQRVNAGGINERERGAADVALGFKWHWQDGDEAAGKPATAWLLHVDTPSGSRPFRGEGWRPSLRLVAEWELPGGYSAGVMPGLYRDRNDGGKHYWGGVLAAVVGKSFTDTVRGFVEVSGQQLTSSRNGGKLITFDAGVAYLLASNLQLDLAVSRGLNRNSPDFGWTLGISYKH